MQDAKTKYRAGFADAVLAFNTNQMRKQTRSAPGAKASRFVNYDTGRDPRSHDVGATDILFFFNKPFIGRNGAYSQTIPTMPKVHSALTGLQEIPGGMGRGIVEAMENDRLSEDMIILAILASIQIVGISLFDRSLEQATTEETSSLTVQVSGVVTASAHEKMWAGGHVRATVPRASEFTSNQWGVGIGEGRALGKVALVPTMVTARDVTSFALTLMTAYMYNGGQNALHLLRQSANYSLFANFAVAMKEFALTAGILYNLAMNERGLAAVAVVPFSEAGVGNNANAQRMLNVGRDLGVSNINDGRATFGQDLRGNAARIYYNRREVNRLAANNAGGPGDAYAGGAWRRGVEDLSVLERPAEVAVFHGILSGLLVDRTTLNNDGPVAAGAEPYTRVIKHAGYVLNNEDYRDDVRAFDQALERFFKLMFPNTSDGGALAVEEFGVELFAAAPVHRARNQVNNPLHDVPNPSQDMYGRMLVQQKQAYAFAIASFENMFNFNDSLRLGRVTSGGDRGGTFNYYYNL